MRMTKRALSIVLAAMMIMSMLVVGTVAASAATVAKIGDASYDSLKAAFADAVNGDTITVLADSNGDGIIAPQGKFQPTGLTVDFGGHTYTVDGTLVGSTGTETNGFQLLKDNTITFKNGTIYSEKAKFLVQNYSNLTLDNMTLTLNNSNYHSGYTLSNNNGNTTIKDTTINANTGGGVAFDVCRYASYPSVNVTVTGDSTIRGDIEVSASGNDAKEGFSLNLESGTLTGEVNVLGSAVTAANNATPGTVSVDDPADVPTFTQVAPVAKIGSAGYTSLEEAFANANDGNTIVLQSDCEGNGIKAPQGKFPTGLTVDFNNHKYTVSGTPVGSTGTETNGFQLLKDNKITFKNGALYGSSYANEDLMRMIQNYSDLTLDGMTVSMEGLYYDQYTMATCNGTTVIKDSTVSAPDFSWAGITDASTVRGAALDMGTFSSYPSIDVTITGTSTIAGDLIVDPTGDHSDNFSLTLEGGEITGDIILKEDAPAAIAAGSPTATITMKDGFTAQEAPEDYLWVDDGNGNKTLDMGAAKIGTTTYATLEAAFAAAVDGDTITLLKDSAGNGIKAPQGKFQPDGLTVDFAGFTYTQDGTLVGSTGTETQAFQLLKDNTITFKNGTITSTKAKMLIQNYSNLTLDNMTLDLNNPNYHYAYTLSNNNGDIVINDTEINANPAGGYAFDVCRYASYPSVNVTVTGNSEINGNVEVDAGSGDAKDGFSLTLESGELNGNIKLTNGAKNAIAATPDKAEVTKEATFTQAAPAGYKWVDDGNGAQTLAPEALVAQITGYQRKAVKTSESESADGNDIGTRGVRVLTKVDKAALAALGTDVTYGYVVAKVTGKDQATANFSNLKKDGGNGEKTIDCTGSLNNGIDGVDNSYVTLAVNGMTEGDQIAVRFYYTVDGVTTYAKYVKTVTVTYDGIIATY